MNREYKSNSSTKLIYLLTIFSLCLLILLVYFTSYGIQKSIFLDKLNLFKNQLMVESNNSKVVQEEKEIYYLELLKANIDKVKSENLTIQYFCISDSIGDKEKVNVCTNFESDIYVNVTYENIDSFYKDSKTFHINVESKKGIIE